MPHNHIIVTAKDLLLASWSCVRILSVKLNGSMYHVWSRKSPTEKNGTAENVERENLNREPQKREKRFYDTFDAQFE